VSFFQGPEMSFWIDTASPLQIAIASRPQGGEWLEKDVRLLRDEGIDILVSLLCYPESRELDLDEERAACASVGISFVNFPIPDREVPPSPLGFLTFAQFVHKRAKEGLRVGVHCRACIGRSSVLLATVLRLEGFSAREAFDRISNARGLRVPDTAAQARWVARLAI
jgi:protein-tyrosine phosphatase